MLAATRAARPARLALRSSPCASCRAGPSAAVGLRLRIRFYSVGGAQADLPVPNKTNVWDSVDEAVKDVKSGDTLLSGGMWTIMPPFVCTHSNSL